MNVRFKRLFAFIIDWNITLFPFVCVFSFIALSIKHESEINPLIVLLLFSIILFAFGAFILRDVIFKGRSLGKRIFGLCVYDKNSLTQANLEKCLLRNIFLFLYIIDGILLLATGKTIGDRVAGTLVTTKQGLESYTEETQNNSSVSKKEKTKKIILTFTVIIGCIILFIGLIQSILNTIKNTKEYGVAYNYFIQSDTFKELNVNESEIRFNQYSSYTSSSENNPSFSKTAEIGFVVDFKSFTVVCHKENGNWKVCNECTLFK